MAAVVRLKRRLEEDPLETLILNCKRRKPLEGSGEKSEDVSAVLRLAGTSQKEESIDTLLKRHKVADIANQREHFKRHPVDISSKIRANTKELSKTNRYKVVNAFRKTLDTEEEESQTKNVSQVTVFDVETEQNSNEPSSSQDEDSTYVYDFYYTSSDDLGEANIEDSSVHPLNDPLIFGSARDNGLDGLDSDDNSEDSNAENHWMNDYPDEEDLESITEDDMIQAVNKLGIEDMLSSDSGDEEVVYGNDEEDFQEKEAEVDREDELRYGDRKSVV